jgi:SAM-dependent methyltransferase
MAIVDLGCGPGGNGAWLAEHGHVIGIDRSATAVALCARRHPTTDPVRADAVALPLGDATIDLVVAITVLYAVDDDARAMAEIARILRPSGAAVLVEPAHPWLGRGHDRVVGGRRRYRRGELASRATAAGLDVRRATDLHASLVAPAAALAAIDRARRARADDRSDLTRGRSRALAGLAALERRWTARWDLPLGTSTAVVAVRPPGPSTLGR